MGLTCIVFSILTVIFSSVIQNTICYGFHRFSNQTLSTKHNNIQGMKPSRSEAYRVRDRYKRYVKFTETFLDTFTTQNNTFDAFWNTSSEVYTVNISPLPSEDPSQFVTYRIANVLSRFGRPVVFCCGLVGNTLSLLVMVQQHNRRISCCVYMGALAITDNILLVIITYMWIVGQVSGMFLTSLQCGIFVYIAQAAIYAGMVFILCMTVDRFVAVKFPLKCATWCSTKRAKVTIMITACAVLIYSIPYLLYTQAILHGAQCSSFREPNSALKVFTWINIFLTSVTPFTILIVLNFFIINTIRNRGKFFRDNNHGNTSNTAAGEEEKAKDRQLTMMLLLVSFAFLILTMPQYIRLLFVSLTGSPQTAKANADFILALQATNVVYFCNNAVNFFLYCMGGSKFRQDLYNLVPCTLVKPVPIFQRETSFPSTATDVSNSNI